MGSEQSNLDFTDLDVWKKARELKKDIFQLVKKFPPEEKFRLTDQMIRCARSINANIAEGHGRYSHKDRLHFCIISRGSFSELRNHLYDALDCDYISPAEFESLKIRVFRCANILNGYISYMRKKLDE